MTGRVILALRISQWSRVSAGLAIATMIALLPAGERAIGAGVEKPEIVSRAEWGAAAANASMMKAQAPKGIIIHHTGVRQQPKLTLEKKLHGLQSFSMSPGTLSGTKKKKPAWGDMPYHFYIDVSGRIGEGREVAFAGDTNTGYDTDGFIQVVVEGEFEKEKPVPAQLAALDKLTTWLAAAYRIPPDRITGHDDHAPSDCPGRNLKPYLDELRGKVAAALQ